MTSLILHLIAVLSLMGFGEPLSWLRGGLSRLPGSTAAAPSDTPWSINLVTPGEPGEPLVVSGTVYRPDGKTPAAGIRLYVYQTDARGYYSEDHRGGNSDPRIRGWLTTDARGRYRIRTIKSGSYPGSRNPSHIHSKVVLPGGKEQLIEEFQFADDPYISEKDRKKATGKGDVSPVMKVTRGDNGVLQCTRNIVLGE
jgi:protocatechuate 3,4-dioxygenase beta subunit